MPITDMDDPTSSIPAVKHHLSANANIPGDAPFFAFETNSNSSGWAPMTRDWFLARCSEIWIEAGLESRTGHCFRIGGATELLLRGVPPDIVQVLEGWKSQAFLEYWRKIDSILPLFISDSFSSSHLQLVKDSIECFRRTHI